MADDAQQALLTLTADIVAAHVSNNRVSVSDVPTMISHVHAAVSGLGQATPDPEQQGVPAVSVRASVKPDFIVCLEDGKKMKMLRRHLSTEHGMSPAEYRAKWKLPKDYPMVAPNYSDSRRILALGFGLGRKKAEKVQPTPARGSKAGRVAKPEVEGFSRRKPTEVTSEKA